MKRTLCVFNRTRQSFLGLNVGSADTVARLRGLLGQVKFAPEDGLWLNPSVGVPTFGVPFPIDVIYLDGRNRVIHLVEHLDPFRISPIRSRCSSVLELRPLTIYSSHTKVGDELLICFPEDMHRKLKEHLADSRSTTAKDHGRVHEVQDRPARSHRTEPADSRIGQHGGRRLAVLSAIPVEALMNSLQPTTPPKP